MTKKTIIFLTSFLSFLSLVIYLFQVESFIQNNYIVREKQIKINHIKEENLSLQDKYLKALSLENAEKEISKLSLVKISEIKYIPISVSSFSMQTAKR